MHAENQEDGSILVTFELSGEPRLSVVSKQGKLFSQFDLTGFIPGGEKGLPELLTKQVNLAVDGNTDYRLELVDSQSQAFELLHPYLPSRGVITRNEDPNSVPYVVEPLRSAYPAEVIEQAEPFFIRNVSGYTLRSAVNQVDGNQAKIYTKLVFKLKPEGARSEFRAMEDRVVVEEIHDVVKNMFLNTQSGTRAAWPYELGDKGELLVVYTSRDKAAIQPYIEHKRRMGFTVSTQEVAKGTHVKKVIQSAYDANKKLLYVQLVGDWADIKCDTTTSNGEVAAIDNALGLVSGNDNYFDLIIGRFSAENPEQVATQVKKAIAYETNGAKSWQKKGLMIASDEGEGSGDDREADITHLNVIKDKKLLKRGGFSAVATAYDRPNWAPMEAAVNPVNEGLGVINYTGHGIHYKWGTTDMDINAVNKLTNGDKQPVIFSVACVVGQYNSSKANFAESWLRKENGGAVAAVMSTIYQPWLPPMIAQDYMNDLLVGGYNYADGGSGTNTDHGKKAVGAIVFNAFNLMMGETQSASALNTVKSWIIFGDCTLNMAHEGAADPGDDVNETPLPAPLSIKTQPRSQKVDVGASVSFSIGIEGGVSPYTYQWHKNNVALSGATSATYTFKAASADNGASFHVVVKDKAGKSLKSSVATLTVNPVEQPDDQPTVGGELMVNGGFEGGAASWTVANASIGRFAAQPAQAGLKCAWMGGKGKKGTAVLSQTLTIPAKATNATLSFFSHVDTAEKSKTKVYDKCTLVVKNSSGKVLKDFGFVSNMDAAPGYKQYRLDMTAFKGQTVQIYFEATEDVSNQTSFVFDSFSLIAK